MDGQVNIQVFVDVEKKEKRMKEKTKYKDCTSSLIKVSRMCSQVTFSPEKEYTHCSMEKICLTIGLLIRLCGVTKTS